MDRVRESTAEYDARPGQVELRAGERLDRRTFHARYELMPAGFRAELVEGIVHMPSPVRRVHGKPTAGVTTWLGTYDAATPGVEALDNTSVLLSDTGEPQPDGCLLIQPEYGGQTTVDSDDYVVGAPELVVEVAASTGSLDLREKRRDYEKAGVREYIVLLPRQTAILWLARVGDAFVEMAADADCIFRSHVFPGLWLNGTALITGDLSGVLETLHRGLASPEHAAFVAALRSRRKINGGE